MINKFVNFLYDFTNPYKTGDEMIKIVESSNASVKFKSGGDGKLAVQVHESIQLAVADIVEFKRHNRWDHDRRMKVKNVETLLSSTIGIWIENETDVSKESKIQIPDIQKAMIENVFKPLLSQSEEIYKNFGEPEPIIF